MTDRGPLKEFAPSQVWRAIATLACEQLAWTQMLALTGEACRPAGTDTS